MSISFVLSQLTLDYLEDISKTCHMFDSLTVTTYALHMSVNLLGLTICDCLVPVKTSERSHS
jgi:hypothetical protein